MGGELLSLEGHALSLENSSLFLSINAVKWIRQRQYYKLQNYILVLSIKVFYTAFFKKIEKVTNNNFGVKSLNMYYFRKVGKGNRPILI